MGGLESKQDGVYIDDQQEYAKWPMESVRAAHTRLQGICKQRECEDLSLSKHDFWEIFTDYSAVVDGQFLCLPIEQYELFDPENTGKVYALAWGPFG